jgi:diacylglycerol O-acyltransferase / wax synthase
VERAIHRLNQWYSTGVITNVPGPRSPLHLAGARLVGTVGWGGMTGHLNLGAAFISLDGRVFSGLVTDEAITPDPDRLLAMIGDEWHRLLAPGGVLVG